MQSIEEIIAEAVAKKRAEDNQRQEKAEIALKNFIASVPPSLAACITEIDRQSSWIDVLFNLPNGAKIKADICVFGNRNAEWRPWVFNVNLAHWEYGRKYKTGSDAIGHASDAINLQHFLKTKEIKI